MLATVRTTMMPEFSVHVYPLLDEKHVTHQRYVLVLHDGTAGAMELVFPTAQDLRAFLRDTRDALDAARQEAQARRAWLRPQAARSKQSTLF